ncbi:MAG: SEC-C domain-containing protein [Acidobacteria bacterium]|nr:SEC-C domain-containing protein [Acidobacteriota bacterium]
MADAEWRLRRVRLHQELLLTARIHLLATDNPTHSPDLLQALAFEALHREIGFSKFLTYEAKFERQYDRAYQGWLRHQQKPAHPHPPCEVPAAGPVRTDEPNPGPKSAGPVPHAIPRGAPCPCGSGEKYKRCCGRQAPALLHGPAAAPAPSPTPAGRTQSAPLPRALRKNLSFLPRTI